MISRLRLTAKLAFAVSLLGLQYYPQEDKLVLPLFDGSFHFLETVSRRPALTSTSRPLPPSPSRQPLSIDIPRDDDDDAMDLDTDAPSDSPTKMLTSFTLSEKIREVFVVLESGGQGQKDAMKALGVAGYGELGTMIWLHEFSAASRLPRIVVEMISLIPFFSNL